MARVNQKAGAVDAQGRPVAQRGRRPRPRPPRPKPAAKPPKPLPAANCVFAYFLAGQGLVAGAPDCFGPAYVAAAFSAGQEASEGDTAFQWTHVLLCLERQLSRTMVGQLPLDPWPLAPTAAVPGVAPGAGDELANAKVYLYPLGAKLLERMPAPNQVYQVYQFPLGGTPPPALPNGLPYFIVFMELVDRGKPRAHWRMYLRRGVGRER